MAIKKYIADQLKESFPEMLFAAKQNINYIKQYPIWSSDEAGGCLGYPAAVLLFCIVDAIGSYLKNNTSLDIVINKKSEIIDGTDNHFRVLNSKYFSQNLSGEHICNIYQYRNNLVHNLAMPEQYILQVGKENEPAFPFQSRKKGGRFPFVNLLPFYMITEKAVNLFLDDLDAILAHSTQVNNIRVLDVKLKQSFLNNIFSSSGTTKLNSEASGTNSSTYIIFKETEK